MPKFLISRVKAIATTYIVEAETELKAVSEFASAVSSDSETSYELYNMDVIEDYVQSEGEAPEEK